MNLEGRGGGSKGRPVRSSGMNPRRSYTFNGQSFKTKHKWGRSIRGFIYAIVNTPSCVGPPHPRTDRGHGPTCASHEGLGE
jgi:hypothetical protein